MRNAQVTKTITVQTSAYVASTCIGGLQTLTAFNSPPMPAGILDEFILISKGGNTVAATAYIFDGNPVNSSFLDRQAIAISPLDLPLLTVAPFVLTPAVPQGSTFSVASFLLAASVANFDNPPTPNLYVAIVANGNITPAGTADLVLTLGLALD